MLYVNGELLDLNKDSHYVREYIRYRDELLNSYDFPITISTRDKPIINATGMVEPPKTIIIPAVATVNDENGVVEWRYTEVLARNGKYTPRNIFISGAITIERKDVDLAFFLIYKSPFGVSSGNLYLKDEKKEIDEYVKKRSKLTGLAYMLYDEDSPLSDSDVRTIALAIGISNADSDRFTTNQVKKMVEDAVTQGELTGDPYVNYRVFKELSKVGDWVKLLARIQKMYDNRILEYDAADGSFYLLNPEGGREKKIFKINITDYRNRDRLLAKKIMEDDYLNSIISEYFGEKVSADIEVFTKEQLADLPFARIKELAKLKGVNVFGKTREELIKELTGI